MDNSQREAGWSRRQFLGDVALTGAAAWLGVSPAHAEPPPETTRIRIHDSPIACFAPEFVAEDLLKAEGFTDVEYVKTPLAEGPSWALASGDIDFTMNDPPAHLLAIDAKGSIVILAGVHTGCWELFGNAGIHSLRDLKGRTVAAPKRSSRREFVAAMVASVGLDPDKDIVWVDHEPSKSMQLFAEGKIDAFMGFAPEPQELRSKNIGHVVLNTLTDRPWSQYFCCMVAGNATFVRKNPVATKRALRAFMKAADFCVSNPEAAARLMVKRGVAESYEYVLQAVKEIGYRKWREYDSGDTVRFWALRMREAGLIKATPKQILAEATDWRYINEIRKGLKA